VPTIATSLFSQGKIPRHKVILPDGTHLNQEGKLLNKRFQAFLLQTKTDAVDEKFHPLPLGESHCSGFFKDMLKSISREQMLARIAAAEAGAGGGAGAGERGPRDAIHETNDWINAAEFVQSDDEDVIDEK